MAINDSKDIEQKRWLAQCALLDNLYEMSLKLGSPYPGSMRGIPLDKLAKKTPQAGTRLTITEEEANDPSQGGLEQHLENVGGELIQRTPPRKTVRAAKCIPKNIALYQAPPEYTMAHFNNTVDADRFFEATPAQLSALVPKIILEVLGGEEGSQKWEKVEFAPAAVAKDFINRQRLLLSGDELSQDQKATDFVKQFLGDDYLAQGGIKSFEFSFDNNMFYERNIRATLELHFQSASDLGLGIYRRLFRISNGRGERGPTKDPTEHISNEDARQDIINCAAVLKNAAITGLPWDVGFFAADTNLALGGIIVMPNQASNDPNIPGALRVSPDMVDRAPQGTHSTVTGIGIKIPDAWQNNATETSKTARAKYLRCTIGWASGNPPIDGFDEKLVNAVKNTQRTFVLNMTDYDVDFKEDGQVAVTFNYVASIDAYTRQEPNMNILENLFTTQVAEASINKYTGEKIPAKHRPHEYKYSLVPVPSEGDIEALYRPLAAYGIIGSEYSDQHNPSMYERVTGGAPSRNTRAMNPEHALNLTANDIEVLSFNGSSRQDLFNRLQKGFGIERSATSVTFPDGSSRPAGDSFFENRAEHRTERVLGGGYIITRLITQFEDPFGTGKRVFQVQEKAVQLEMSLIKREIREWRKRRKNQTKHAPGSKHKQITKNIESLQKAYSVAKGILAKARQFRKTTQALGFLTAFQKSDILRLAKTETANIVDESGEGNLIKDYQKSETRNKITFYDIEETDGAYGRDKVAMDKYTKWMARVAGEKTYGESSGATDALMGASAGGVIDGDDTFIPFVQLGHFLSHIFGPDELHQHYGMILGTIKLPHPETREKIIYNISDIPLSLASINKWYFDSVIDTGRETYAFRIALRDIITKLVKPMLTKYCVSQYLPPGESPPEISFSTFSAPMGNFITRGMVSQAGNNLEDGNFDPGQYDIRGANAYDNKPGWSKVINKRTGRFKNFAYDADSGQVWGLWNWWQTPAHERKNVKHYYVLYATTPCERGGDYIQDMQQGIYHLRLGADKGILKRIKFRRKEMPYLETMNVENASAGDLDGLLTIPMDADVELVGNNFFRNGQMVYLNAEMGLGPVLADQMRIGGYYMVTKVSNSIDNTGWTTNLNCIWQSTTYSDTAWGGEP